MKKKPKSRLLVFLQRTQMSVYKEGSNKIETWTFDPTLVNDLEIKDEDKFRLAIDAFVNPLKLEGGEAIILLDSSVYFTQKIALEEQRKSAEESPNAEAAKSEEPGLIEKVNHEEDEKVKFMHSMPFSNVFATILTLGKEKVIFSLSRDFYEPFIKEFTDRKYEVTYIYPIVVVNEIFGSSGFTAAAADVMIKSADKYKAYSFLQAPIKKEVGPTPQSTVLPDSSDRKRLYLMLGAFGFLLLVLVGVIMWSRSRDAALSTPPAQPQQPAVEMTPVPVDANAATETLTEPLDEAIDASSSAVPGASTLSVTIRDASGTADAAIIAQERLVVLGFAQVEISEASTQSSDVTIVIVKPTVPDSIRQVVESELTALGYVVSFQESPEISEDIIVTLSSQ